MKLKPSLLVYLALVMACSSTGCNIFRKNKKPKENPAIASEVEAEFRQRWVDHRVAELVGAGGDATAARTQAETEFRARYPYIKDQKP
jgi:hypothetical protein